MKKGDIYIPWKTSVGAMIPNWLMSRIDVSSGAKLCWARLAQYSGEKGSCFPKQSTLAAELGVSERQARNYIAELCDLKLLESVQRGMGMSNEYQFLCPKELDETTSDPVGNIFPTRKEKDFLQDRKNISGPSTLRESSEENHLRSTPHGDFIEQWNKTYPKYHSGDQYLFEGGKDGSAVQRLLKSKLTPEVLLSIAISAWENSKLFNCRQAATISGFASRINQIRSELSAPVRTMADPGFGLERNGNL